MEEKKEDDFLEDVSLERHTGTVRSWRGSYGFLREDIGGKDYFFHESQVPNDMTPVRDLQVTFTIGMGTNNREQALNIRLV